MSFDHPPMSVVDNRTVIPVSTKPLSVSPPTTTYIDPRTPIRLSGTAPVEGQGTYTMSKVGIVWYLVPKEKFTAGMASGIRRIDGFQSSYAYTCDIGNWGLRDVVQAASGTSVTLMGSQFAGRPDVPPWTGGTTLLGVVSPFCGFADVSRKVTGPYEYVIDFSKVPAGLRNKWYELVVVELNAQQTCINIGGFCLVGTNPAIAHVDVEHRSVLIMGDDYCNPSVPKRGDDYCYTRVGHKGEYCEETANKCMDPCDSPKCKRAGPGYVCLAKYVNTAGELRRLINTREGLCRPTYQGCVDTSDCIDLTRGAIVGGETASKILPGYHCDKEYDRTLKLLTDGRIGMCRIGALTPEDCRMSFGVDASDVSIKTAIGSFTKAYGWGINDGQCVLEDCDDDSACAFRFASQAYKCQDMPGSGLALTCALWPCRNHLDCANAEAIIESGVVYACKQGFCTKSSELEFPELKGLSRAYCDISQKRNAKPGFTWVIEGGRCIEKAALVSQCTVGEINQAALKSQCDAAGFFCPADMKYVCLPSTGGIGVCKCSFLPGPGETCGTQTTFTNKGAWCATTQTAPPVCKKWRCAGEGALAKCIADAEARCVRDSDCWYDNEYQWGVCLKEGQYAGCCDYTGAVPPPPPTPCGDGICDSAAGENIITCPADCKKTPEAELLLMLLMALAISIIIFAIYWKRSEIVDNRKKVAIGLAVAGGAALLVYAVMSIFNITRIPWITECGGLFAIICQIQFFLSVVAGAVAAIFAFKFFRKVLEAPVVAMMLAGVLGFITFLMAHALFLIGLFLLLALVILSFVPIVGPVARGVLRTGVGGVVGGARELGRAIRKR